MNETQNWIPDDLDLEFFITPDETVVVAAVGIPGFADIPDYGGLSADHVLGVEDGALKWVVPNLTDLNDVVAEFPDANDIIKFDGLNWVNSPLVITVDQVSDFDPGDYIPYSEKGVAGGVAALESNGSLIIQGLAGGEKLQEWKDSGGTTVTYIDSSGNMYIRPESTSSLQLGVATITVTPGLHGGNFVFSGDIVGITAPSFSSGSNYLHAGDYGISYSPNAVDGFNFDVNGVHSNKFSPFTADTMLFESGSGVLLAEFSSSSATQTLISLSAHDSQSANIMEVKNSSGEVLSSIDASGNISAWGTISGSLYREFSFGYSITINGVSLGSDLSKNEPHYGGALFNANSHSAFGDAYYTALTLSDNKFIVTDSEFSEEYLEIDNGVVNIFKSDDVALDIGDSFNGSLKFGGVTLTGVSSKSSSHAYIDSGITATFFDTLSGKFYVDDARLYFYGINNSFSVDDDGAHNDTFKNDYFFPNNEDFMQFSGSKTGSTAVVFQSGAVGQIPLVVQGYDAQTANLQEWQDNTGDVLLSVEANGDVRGQEFISTRSYSLTRDVYGTVQTVEYSGGRTVTYTWASGVLQSYTDGVNVWTLNYDSNGDFTGITVT